MPYLLYQVSYLQPDKRPFHTQCPRDTLPGSVYIENIGGKKLFSVLPRTFLEASMTISVTYTQKIGVACQIIRNSRWLGTWRR